MSNQQLITEEEIKKNPNAIIYDPFNEDAPPNLPDVPELLDRIIEIMEYMSEKSITNMRKGDVDGYNAHMESKFEQFADRYYGLFRKIIAGEDLSPLLDMLSSIEKIKAGQLTMENAEAQLGDQLAEKYVYPKMSKSKSNEIRQSVRNSRNNK